MASDYTHISYGHPVGYWYCVVQEDNINTVNNTSRVTVHFYVKAVHGGKTSQTYNKTSNTSAKIWINGTLICSRSPATFDVRSSTTSHGYNNWLGSGSATITHDSSGGGTLSIKCYHYCGNTTPSSVTIENTFTLTRINRQPSYSKPLASLWTLPSGTYNVGDRISVNYYPYSSSVTHTIYIKSSIKNYWYRVLEHQKASPNTWHTCTFDVPAEYTNGLGPQQSTTLYILCQCHDPNDNGIELGNKQDSVQIKNNNYDLYFNDLYIHSDTYI